MSHTERLRRSPNAFRQLTGITPAVFDQAAGGPDAPLRASRRQAQGPPRPQTPARGRAQARPRPGRPPADAPDLLPHLHHPRLPRLPLRRRRLGRGPQHQPACSRCWPGSSASPSGGSGSTRRRCGSCSSTPPSGPPAGPTEGQRAYYSGKKKRHTIKNQVVTARRTKPPGPGQEAADACGSRRCPSRIPGSVHDKKVYDRTRAVAPPDARRTGDTAYLGTSLETPTRKPRGGELTAGQKERNRVVVSPSDRGGARDRQDEDLADRRGAVSQPEPASHADHEERGRPAQPDVCLSDVREGQSTPRADETLLCSDSIEFLVGDRQRATAQKGTARIAISIGNTRRAEETRGSFGTLGPHALAAPYASSTPTELSGSGDPSG